MSEVTCDCNRSEYVDEWFGNIGIRHFVCCGNKKKVTR